ncbi:MAG: DUF222 domain-containing protein [Ornithinimicrobium sp.]
MSLAVVEPTAGDLKRAAAESVLDGPLHQMRTGANAALAERGRLLRDSSRGLSRAIERVHTLRADLDRLTLAAVTEAARRGAHVESGLSMHDWIAQRCPWLSRADVSDLVVVVTDGDCRAHAPIVQAVTDGALSNRRAARLLRCLRQVRPVTEPDSYDAHIALVLPVAADLGHSDADLKRVTDHLVAVALSDAEHEEKVQAQRELRGVHESSLADGSLTRFIVTADAEGAATIRAVMSSPLAAPSPDEEGPDPRTATQRRYDALMTVIGRGVMSPEGTPTTAKARVLITMRYDILSQQLTGTGATQTGEVLSPATVRRLACSAEIIPAVLGTDSEILDLGRAARLASPAQHLLLWRRDRGCSYPGCTIPPQWCDAHHLDWFSRGGRTDLNNLALLCGRHHTLVHQRDLSATVGPNGDVHWRRP